MTNRIRFSHLYSKMPSVIHENKEHITYLLAVDTTEISKLPAEFLDWDTEYKTEDGLAHYELPKENVLVLFLFTMSHFKNTLWTTIRRFTPEKERFYRSLVGQRIKIEVEK